MAKLTKGKITEGNGKEILICSFAGGTYKLTPFLNPENKKEQEWLDKKYATRKLFITEEEKYEISWN